MMTTRRIAYFLCSSNVYIVACEATFYKIDWIIDECIEVMVDDIDCHKNCFNNAEDEMMIIGLDKFIKLLPKDKLFNLRETDINSKFRWTTRWTRFRLHWSVVRSVIGWTI